MNPYEELVEKARKEGLIVKEFPLKSSDGRIKGNRIAIRNDIPTIQKRMPLPKSWVTTILLLEIL